MTLSFAHALLPHVAIDASTIHALTAGGFLHSIPLPDSTIEQQSVVSSTLTDLNVGKLTAMRLADIVLIAEFSDAALTSVLAYRNAGHICSCFGHLVTQSAGMLCFAALSRSLSKDSKQSKLPCWVQSFSGWEHPLQCCVWARTSA